MTSHRSSLMSHRAWLLPFFLSVALSTAPNNASGQDTTSAVLGGILHLDGSWDRDAIVRILGSRESPVSPFGGDLVPSKDPLETAAREQGVTRNELLAPPP